VSLFNFEGMADNNSVRVVASRQLKQQVADVQRDIYESHRHRVFALAYYMTGNELEAEQILTGTFVQAFREVEKPKAQDVDTALIGELRQRFPLGKADSPDAVKPDLSPNADLASQNIRRTDLEEAIRTLPATERLLFLLRDVEGYSPEAIAGLTGIPESQVQRSLFTARIRLRRELANIQISRLEAA
jgi:RNA polymerase sigma-70 factor, ECF subfamily